MRGERNMDLGGIKIKDGSSPHARGTPYHIHCYTLFPRFIPACAGNANALTKSDRTISVHPRMRGERVNIIDCWRDKHGSSPHARGTREEDYRELMNSRFIPACAGNALFQSGIRYQGSVHPRMRGERASSLNASYSQSVHPRMRGERPS